jgi:hypothetical protein
MKIHLGRRLEFPDHGLVRIAHKYPPGTNPEWTTDPAGITCGQCLRMIDRALESRTKNHQTNEQWLDQWVPNWRNDQ